jgi:hypothetical protein
LPIEADWSSVERENDPRGKPDQGKKIFFAEFFLRETPAMDLVFFQANIMEI